MVSILLLIFKHAFRVFEYELLALLSVIPWSLEHGILYVCLFIMVTRCMVPVVKHNINSYRYFENSNVRVACDVATAVS